VIRSSASRSPRSRTTCCWHASRSPASAAQAPVSEEALADLKLAITEACGNSVRHAYPDGSGDVSVAYSLRPDSLELVVEDQGTGLDPSAVNTTSDTGESGMGMSIIRAVVDELEVRPGADGKGTFVRMTKLLDEPDPE
jgi:anti-sigma regulatory factor (Ser/Thr protein kinase)